jgi:hypothetical protein
MSFKSAKLRNIFHTIIVAGLAALATGCSVATFTPADIDTSAFLDRAITQSMETIRVTVAVPDEQETKALTGINLYVQDVQPVWIEIENTGEKPIRGALWSVDPDYYSPIEVAYSNRDGFTAAARADMQRWFYENGLPRIIPAGETRSGFVFTHVSSGTKGFNFDLYSNNRDFNFTFFVPVPGFIPDYMTVDFDELYSAEEIRDVDAEGILRALEKFPCCSLDESGEKVGDPFNIVLVGSGLAVRRAMLRGGWNETVAGDKSTEIARQHRYRGRRPDGTFHQSRSDGGENKELRLWLAPMRSGDDWVWLGQVSYDISSATAKNQYVDYRIDPDIDEARRFVLQNLWYSQSLTQFANSGGAGPPSDIDSSRKNFLGSRYYTDGKRVVLWTSEETTGFDEIEFLTPEGHRDQ